MLFIILTFLLVSCGGHSEQIDFISELSVFEPDIDPVNRVNNIALRTMVAGVSSGIFNSDKSLVILRSAQVLLVTRLG